jgi:hypothetical protein
MKGRHLRFGNNDIPKPIKPAGKTVKTPGGYELPTIH